MIIRIRDRTHKTKLDVLHYAEVRVFTYDYPKIRKNIRVHFHQMLNKKYYSGVQFDAFLEMIRCKYDITEIICLTDFRKEEFLGLMPVDGYWYER